MKKVLEMVFRTVGGKEVVLSVPNPKDDLTTQQVVGAMETILSKNIFSTSSGDLRDLVEARVRVIDVQVLA